jgi:predicted RNA binding protein YcfA (HicA-like mRNA interferase family)
MKLPRDLSGSDLVKHLCKNWDYEQVHQVGSHVILQTSVPSRHRIAVPAHNPLRIGTLNAILAAVAAHKGVGKERSLRELDESFLLPVRVAKMHAQSRNGAETLLTSRCTTLLPRSRCAFDSSNLFRSVASHSSWPGRDRRGGYEPSNCLVVDHGFASRDHCKYLLQIQRSSALEIA